MLTQPCTLQPWSRSSPQDLLNSAGCRQAETLCVSIPAVLVMLVSACAPLSLAAVGQQLLGGAGEVLFYSVAVQGKGCLGKGRGLSCGWEVVNPCEKGKAQRGGYFWRLFTLAQGETSLSCVYATPSWHSSRGSADRTMQ